ncbi:MAG TPA: hypothetical protein VF624_13065 [Tepidisphaeraceae bacterium]|jgi:hypothetical protein
MNDWPNLLADVDDGPNFKFIVGLIVAVIYVVAQAASAWKDRQRKSPPPMPHDPRSDPRSEPRYESRAEPPALPSRMPAEVQRRIPQQRRPMQDAPRPQQQGQRTGKRKGVPKAEQARRRAAEELANMTRQPRAQPPERTPAYAPTRSSDAVATVTRPDQLREVVGDADARSRGPSKGQRLRALLRPGNLRKEFILTELLQKPVGLRDDA